MILSLAGVNPGWSCSELQLLRGNTGVDHVKLRIDAERLLQPVFGQCALPELLAIMPA